jgi:hypothetical protein
MVDNSSGRKLRPKKEAENFLIRFLRPFNTQPDKHFEDGITIGKGSILYYPKTVADNFIRCGWGERVYGLKPKILS